MSLFDIGPEVRVQCPQGPILATMLIVIVTGVERAKKSLLSYRGGYFDGVGRSLATREVHPLLKYR